MNRVNVLSSNIKSVGYNSNHMELDVEFTSGNVYRYYKVPIDIYNGLMTAPSHGVYLNREIKNKFPFSLI
jgi:hypothetical protein